MKRLLPKSEFARNVLTLMTGTTIAQAIPIAIAPVLTRIYTPQDFGILASYVAITTILASVVNGRYELAIGLPEKDEDAINIAALGMLIAIGVSLIAFIVILIFNQEISALLKNPSISFWLYLSPLSVFFIGFFNVLNYLNNRKKNFKDIALAQVYKSTTLVFFQVSLGFIKKGALGLIVGQIVSQISANIRLYKNISQKFNIKKSVSRAKMAMLAKRYKSFPKYSMWAGLFNSLSHDMASLLISTLFSASTLGMYYLVQRVLGAPASLISSAISQVFLQQATAERREKNHARKTFDGTIKNLFLIGLPIFTMLFFFSEELFAFIFGERWRDAGKYASALTPLFFVRFIVSTVSMMNIIFEKNHIGFYWQLALMLLSIGTLIFAYLKQLSFLDYLYLSSVLTSLHYLILLLIMASYNKIPKKKA